MNILLNIVIAICMFLFAFFWHEEIHIHMARAVGGGGYILWNKNKGNVLSWRPSAIVSLVKGRSNNIFVRLAPIPLVLPFNFLLFLSLSVPLCPRLLSVFEWSFYSLFFGFLLTMIESYRDIVESLDIWRGREICQL